MGINKNLIIVNMNINKLVLIGVIFGLFLSSCTKNEAALDIIIKVDKTEIFAGENAVFSITGYADFVTFYNGEDSSHSYSNYPLVDGVTADFGNFTNTYNKHGVFNATFIASSYGEWGTESLIQQFDFTINVIDNRTGISSFKVKKAGLGGNEYFGEINEDSGIISVVTNSGTDISNMQTSIITDSNDALVFNNDIIVENNDKFDYSGDNVIFTVEALDGTKRDWTILVSND